MLIFNSFDSDDKFIEIESFEDLEHVESNCYVFIRITSGTKQYLETCFSLGKKLYKNNIRYAVLLDDSIQIDFMSFMRKDNINEINNEKYNIKPLFPFYTIFFMFAKHGASFFMLDKKNYKIFHIIQTMINYYLMDMKLLLIVDSYMDIEHIFLLPANDNHKSKNNISKHTYNDVEKSYHKYIGVDGIIDRSLIINIR